MEIIALLRRERGGFLGFRNLGGGGAVAQLSALLPGLPKNRTKSGSIEEIMIKLKKKQRFRKLGERGAYM